MAWQVAASKRKGRAARISPEAKAVAAEVLEALYTNSTFTAIAHAASAAEPRRLRGNQCGTTNGNTGEERP